MLKSDSELQVFISVLFVKPIRLRPRFRKDAEIQFSVVFFCRDLRDRHPPSEQSDEGGCASFSFSMNEKPGDLNYSRLLI